MDAFGDKMRISIMVVHALTHCTHNHPDAYDYLQGLKAGARKHWWRCLRRLLTYPHKSAARNAITQAWIELGVSLQLDQKTEARRYQKHARRHCAWQEDAQSLLQQDR